MFVSAMCGVKEKVSMGNCRGNMLSKENFFIYIVNGLVLKSKKAKASRGGVYNEERH